jgi:ABC-type Zn uptake system ZnuABC Zn-binding protein ZnuA
MKQLITAYVGEGNMSLDKEFIDKIGEGKIKAEMVLANVSGNVLEELEEKNNRYFDFEYYRKLEAECDNDSMYEYFSTHSKDIPIDSYGDDIEIVSAN